jgi:hypothetical protein
VQRLRKLYQAIFVGNTEQGAADGHGSVRDS